MQMQDGDWRLLLLPDLPLLTAELGFLACLLHCECLSAWILQHSCLALEGNWLVLERTLPSIQPFIRNDWK